MIPTASLAALLPTPTLSTTVPNARAAGSLAGDFAGSFARANDDAAVEGAPTPTPLPTLPATASDALLRQDVAATGNTLPTVALPDAAPIILPALATLLPEQLANSPAQLLPTQPKAETPVPDVSAKPTVAARPSATVARPASFAVSPRAGKAKDHAPATPSDDASDATTADQPAVTDPPAIDPPVVVTLAEIPLVPQSAIPPLSPEENKTALDEVVVAPAASTVGSAKPAGKTMAAAKPLAKVEPQIAPSDATPSAPIPRQSRGVPIAALAEPTTPASQLKATALALAAARRAPGVVDPIQVAPGQAAPIAALPVTAPVAIPPLQIVALAAAVPVAPQPSGESVPISPEPRSAPVEGAPPATDTAPIVTPRWVATDATTPVALTLARPEAVQPQPGTVASASQVFGAAIQAATKARDDRDTPDQAAFSTTVSAPTSTVTIKTADAQQAPLDMRQERWPHAMIERIEILRDAADATDTRIRLIPDALGAIDVSVRKDGDTVHVHFNAEQSATRTLLADAQPRLVELAEARGLKLGQGALQSGSDQAGSNANSSQQRAQSTARAPVPSTSVTVDATEDTRIA